MIECLDSKALPYLSPCFGPNCEAHKVEDAQQRTHRVYSVLHIWRQTRGHARGETFFYKAVRDKESVRLQNEGRRRMGKKSVGVQALLNVPADGQTWAFSY